MAELPIYPKMSCIYPKILALVASEAGLELGWEQVGEMDGSRANVWTWLHSWPSRGKCHLFPRGKVTLSPELCESFSQLKKSQNKADNRDLAMCWHLCLSE